MSRFMDITFRTDIGATLSAFAENVNENDEQALARFGVAVARNVSNATNPKYSTAGSRKKKAAATMRKVVEPVPAKTFSQIRKEKKPRLKLGGQWVSFSHDRMIEDPSALWNTIEKHRINGKTENLPANRRYICKQSDFNKVATKRVKLWGAAKGGWIGAGNDIAATQKGLDRISIGKNVHSWAQRHTDKGKGTTTKKRFLNSLQLFNYTKGAAVDNGLSKNDTIGAIHHARKAVFKYYSSRMRSMKIKGGPLK